MRDTNIDQELCIFLVQMLKTVSILFINSGLVKTLHLVGLLSNLWWKPYAGPILECKAMHAIFQKRAKNIKEGQKRARYLKILAKMYKI